MTSLIGTEEQAQPLVRLGYDRNLIIWSEEELEPVILFGRIGLIGWDFEDGGDWYDIDALSIYLSIYLSIVAFPHCHHHMMGPSWLLIPSWFSWSTSDLPGYEELFGCPRYFSFLSSQGTRYQRTFHGTEYKAVLQQISKSQHFYMDKFSGWTILPQKERKSRQKQMYNKRR